MRGEELGGFSQPDLAGFLPTLGLAGQRQARDQGPGLVDEQAQRGLRKAWSRRESLSPATSEVWFLSHFSILGSPDKLLIHRFL